MTAPSPWLWDVCWGCRHHCRVLFVGPASDLNIGTAPVLLCGDCCRYWQDRIREALKPPPVQPRRSQ